MTYPWGHTRRYNSYTDYLKQRFGGRIQKIAIDAGFTCPNRDGTAGVGGCTYCDNNTFNPSYCRPEKSIVQQINEGIGFHANRYRRASRFLAYFQPYSNTYAPLEKLKALYEEALVVPGVTGLVIGTRPDCIDDAKLSYLSHLARDYYVMVEYGIESCYDHTLDRINRGHTFRQTAEAIEKTARAGLATGGHLIFGLPGETREQMLEEASILSRLPLNMLKFHQLQIFRDTVLEQEYRAYPGRFDLFGINEYIDFVIDFTERLSPRIMIERFASEAPPRYLVAPDWGKIRYDEVLRRIELRLEEKNTFQGCRFDLRT